MRIFIGYDHAEAVAFHTLAQSIIDNASGPVSIHPVKMSMLPMYNRERDPRQSNEFSFTRFLTPYLAGYSGWALFMDCDMMFRADPYELYQLLDPTKAVMVCKHDYTPKTSVKYLGNVQHQYPRKNWSSVMLFNCNHNDTKRLTPDVVNTASGRYLHRFEWTSDEFIGELPLEWNWLVGEYEYNPDTKNVHWTIGGPYFHEYSDCDYSDEWRSQYDRMRNCDQLVIPTVPRVSSK